MKFKLLQQSLIFITFLICLNRIYAQEYTEYATLITVNNDTIKGWIEHQIAFDRKIAVKSYEDFSLTKIKVNDLKSLETKVLNFERVEFFDGKKKRSELMRLLEDGTMKLYMGIEFIQGSPVMVSGSYNPYLRRVKVKASKYSDGYDIDYVVKKGGQAVQINRDNFYEVMVWLTKDAPKMNLYLADKRYGFEDGKYVVHHYNLEINKLSN